MIQTRIEQLSRQYVEDWVELYNRFCTPFAWISPTNVKEALALLEEGPASCSYVALRNRRAVAIATLDMRGKSTTATIRNFAFRASYRGLRESLLSRLTTTAEENGFKYIEAWSYDSIDAITRLLTETGFRQRSRESLMLMQPGESPVIPDRTFLVFRSLADGLSVDPFVEANQAAFKGDPSRLLEAAELERWVSDLDGFIPDIQLAAQTEGTIVGTVMSELTTVRRGKSFVNLAWVYGLGIIPTARRQGIGRALIDELLKRLRLRGVSEVWLLTDAEGGARAFYEQVGFKHYAYLVQYCQSLR